MSVSEGVKALPGWPDAFLSSVKVTAVSSAPVDRSCTCHPDDAPTPCQHRYAASECQANALGPEILVTPEMIAPGMGVLACLTTPEACGGIDEMRGFAERIYRAMAAHAPVELVSPGELAALRERDEALAALTKVRAWNTALEADTAALRHELAHRYTLLEVGELLAARDARIAELDTMLAARPAPVTDTPKSDPIANAIQARDTDRRRMGL